MSSINVDSDKEILYKDANGREPRSKAFILCFIGITVLMVGVGVLIGVGVYIAIDRYQGETSVDLSCSPPTPCLYTLVESMPENLTYNAGDPSHPSTYSGIRDILGMAKETIEIASFYWTIRGDDLPVKDPTSWEGEQLFKDLLFAGQEKGIKIRIVQSYSKTPINDTLILAKEAGAEVRSLDLTKLLKSGILHTKMWLVDRKHFYLGSANLDWRSFTQVKEMGTIVKQCDCLAQDIGKIFDAYWYLATPTSTFPVTWPSQYNTMYNEQNPMVVNFNGTNYYTFISSSPPPICPTGRSQDGATIVNIINSARTFVYVAVMDYFPTTQFKYPRKYWPDIDDALRSAAFNKYVTVRLLFSYWNNTWDEMFVYMRSLQDLKMKNEYVNIEIDVKLFVVPAFTDAQKKIPFARVNHNKYMVTDKSAYIGTSNWSGDYFLTTAGIGIVVNGSSHDNSSDIRQQLEDVFIRDWNSKYTFPLDHFNVTNIA
ncbi:phospholipase D [Mactra antiquata]